MQARETRWGAYAMRVGWPAFLAACVLELVVFALVDPHDMHWPGHASLLSRQGVYTIAFFVFWAIASASGVLTVLLGTSAAEPPPGRRMG